VRVHDIGLRLWRNEQGEVGFEVIVGGGLGRTPMIGKTLREFLPKDELLAYLEATLRVYNRYGRRDNLYKARIKILVHEIGTEKMREDVEAEYAAIKGGALKLPAETIEAIARQFAPPALRHRPAVVGAVEALKLEDRDFALWLKSNVSPHRLAGYRIVTASLKPAGAPPGRRRYNQSAAPRHDFRNPAIVQRDGSQSTCAVISKRRSKRWFWTHPCSDKLDRTLTERAQWPMS